jgi:hypothetical protein
MSRFPDSYVSRVLFATPAPTRSFVVLPAGGAGSGHLCSTRTGPSCTTCAALARNGERSMGAVPSPEGGERSISWWVLTDTGTSMPSPEAALRIIGTDT